MAVSSTENKYKIKIDDTYFNIAISELHRKADVLDKSAYRSEDGDLHREVIGTYYNYTLKFGMMCRTQEEREEYNRLFDTLSTPMEYRRVTLPHDGIEFEGYFASVEDDINYLVDDETMAAFKGLQCNLIARLPRKRPGGGN
jgi:hypothetical protein